MDQQPIDSFPPEVIEKLKTYVYRLIDPRNGETFYISRLDDAAHAGWLVHMTSSRG